LVVKSWSGGGKEKPVMTKLELGRVGEEEYLQHEKHVKTSRLKNFAGEAQIRRGTNKDRR